MRTLVLWCPDWPVTAAIAAAGLAPDAPVAVVHANRVVACSTEARAAGVRRNLRRREAQARCTALEVLPSDDSRDARAFEPLVAAIAAAITPRVEVVRPGVCALATRGPSRYFGGDDALAALVVDVATKALAQSRELVRVGIADGVFAATLAARRGRVVAAGETAAFLAPFSLAAVDDPVLVDLLRRLGLRTLGDLASLSPGDVLGRFGPSGDRASRLARGLDPLPLSPRVPPPELVVQVALDPPAERVDIAAFAARGMADELHCRLAALALACTRVRIEAETEHGESLTRVWRHEGALTVAAMADRVRWQLDGWIGGSAAGRPSGGLTLLRLVPEEVVPDTGRQSGFWGGATEAGERAARAFARVQGLLGPGAVTTAVPAGGRSPADAAKLVPWGDALPGRTFERMPPWPGRLPAPSPATVHPVPLPADMVDVAGVPVAVTARTMVSAPPALVAVGGGRAAEVLRWAGPWPIDERWWDPAGHRRCARFQVVTADGAAYLLVLEGGRWWVEGTYD